MSGHPVYAIAVDRMPAWPSNIRRVFGTGDAMGVFVGKDVEAMASTELRLPTQAWVVCWAGRCIDQVDNGDDDEVAQESTRVQFGPDPRTFGPNAWSRFDRAVKSVASARGVEGAGLLIRTHARHVLSDAVGCVRAMTQWRGAAERGSGATGDSSEHRLSVMFDPVMMLTPDLLERGLAVDLVSRSMEMLEHPALQRLTSERHRRVGAVVLSSCRVVDDEVVPTGLQEADEISHVMCALAGRLGADSGNAAGLGQSSVPIVLLDERLDEQLALLKRAGVMLA